MAQETTGTPYGVNHIVLNVRNMDESHKFWTEIVGFKQVGTLKLPEEMGTMPRMQFYSGLRNGQLNHHDIALVENSNIPPPPEGWNPFASALAINHIAVAMPDRESWLKKLEAMQTQGVKFHLRVNHGMTHSAYITDPNGYGVEMLYELPREMWEKNIDAGLNYFQLLPTEGDEALVDDIANAPKFG